MLVSLLIYLSLLLGIAKLSHKKKTTQSDLLVGGRSLNYWVTALSAHASDMSAWLFLALPSVIFLKGLSHAWIALGLLLGMFATWQLVAKRLRVQSEQLRVTTLVGLFYKRFGKSPAVCFLSAVLILAYLANYLSAGLVAMGYLIENMFDIPYQIAIALSLGVVLTYTMYGGFVAIAWTDFFQALFLLFVILFLPLAVVVKLGGFSEVFSKLQERGFTLSFVPGSSYWDWVQMLGIGANWGLGYFGMPHVISKFMGIEKPEELKKSMILGMCWQFLALFGAVSVGLVAVAYFSETVTHPEMIFAQMTQDLFAPGIAGFILCAVLAANLSTMDSQLLVCATVLSEDVQPHLPKAVKQRIPHNLWLFRSCVLFLAFVAWGLAGLGGRSIQDTVFYSWIGLGGSFGPLVLFALYSKQTSAKGAIAGLLIGALVPALWSYLAPYALGLPAMPATFLLSSLAIFVFSRVFP